ncbi:MAG: glycogen debranching enzyme N-terminal domain-containing protein, partial [Planctomycetes bacterium]|nr:glycogen debranching enzyme N-terminal domain-containing protein [Planctomycetota bacterium]
MNAILDPESFDLAQEWLQSDGLGGYAMGTAGLVRTRRYHGLLVSALQPPLGRKVLVQGLEVFYERGAQREALSAQRYAGDVIHPAGRAHLVRFTAEPWPRWTWRLPTGEELTQELVMHRGAPIVALRWRLRPARRGSRLSVRLLLGPREDHALHHENPAFDFATRERGRGQAWEPYAGLASIVGLSSGRFRAEPLWYRRFEYSEEIERGFEAQEDLGSPGLYELDLSTGEAVLLLAREGDETSTVLGDRPARRLARELFATAEERASTTEDPLVRAAEHYFARRGTGLTLIAGYPWFADWGRDTFLALRGLALATGKLEEAEAILLEWSSHVSRGMLPNRFPDRGEAPEYNTVDASLWYVVAVHEWQAACKRAGRSIDTASRLRLQRACDAILAGYQEGTRFGIHADTDGLLACGEPGVTQLTWMDARVHERPITPRVGKPVEIQALWIRSLECAGERDARWRELARRARASFAAKFWSEEREGL